MEQIGVPSVPLFDSGDLVLNKFVDAWFKSTYAYNQSFELLSDMRDFLIGVTPIDLLPFFEMPEFEMLDLTLGEKPTPPTLDDFPPLQIPDLDVPTPTFNYSPTAYVSDLRDALEEKLIDGVENAGTGLGADVENAIWTREQERAELALTEETERVSEQWAESGFELPDGVLSGLLLSLDRDYLNQRATSSRDIATKQAELARHQSEVFLQQSNQLESIKAQQHTAAETLVLEAAKAEPEIIIAIFKAAVEQVNVQVAVYNALAVKANAQAEIYRAQMQGYMADAQVGQMELEASVKYFDALVKAATAESEAHTETDKLRILQINQYLQLRLEAMRAMAQVAAQIAAAALTGASVSASLNSQSSTSMSGQASVNYTISESA